MALQGIEGLHMRGTIIEMIEQAQTYRLDYRHRADAQPPTDRHFRMDALFWAVRQDALLDAWASLGNDVSAWRRPNGLFVQ
jgi:hypothetical protein